MNRKLLTVASLLFLLPGLVPAMARRGGPPSEARRGLGAGMGHGSQVDARHLMRLARQLGLSEEQRSAFRELAGAERAELQPVIDELRQIRQGVVELTRHGAFTDNESEVTELLVRQGELLTSVALSGQRVKAGFFGLLTEDQLAQLDELSSQAGHSRRGRGPGRRARSPETAPPGS